MHQVSPVREVLQRLGRMDDGKMNVAQGRLVIARYRSLLQPIPEASGPFDRKPTQEALSHVHGMLDKMEAFLDIADESPEDWDKFNRWLGFCQGVFWPHGDYTLNQMRKHNRTKSPHV